LGEGCTTAYISLLRRPWRSPKADYFNLVATSSSCDEVERILGLFLACNPVGQHHAHRLLPDQSFSAAFDWTMFASSAGIALIAGFSSHFHGSFLPTFSTCAVKLPGTRSWRERASSILETCLMCSILLVLRR
jgi:hypothetical protein